MLKSYPPYDTWWNLCQSQKGYGGVGILACNGLVSVSEGLIGASTEDAKEARVLASHRIAIVNVYAPSAIGNGGIQPSLSRRSSSTLAVLNDQRVSSGSRQRSQYCSWTSGRPPFVAFTTLFYGRGDSGFFFAGGCSPDRYLSFCPSYGPCIYRFPLKYSPAYQTVAPFLDLTLTTLYT